MKTRRSTTLLLLALTCVMAPQTATAASTKHTDLTPPPPDFYTCRTGGSRTICQGAQTLHFAEPTGIFCGTGTSSFQIFDTSIEKTRETAFYDSHGRLTSRTNHNHYRGAWSNPATGATAPYVQNQNERIVLTVPGDPSTATVTVTGEIVMRSGTGAPVLLDAGRQVFDDTGQLVFSAGPHVFTSNDPAVFDKVCAALR